MIDPMAAFDAVRDQFFTYYDTPFGIADADVQRDRREALDRPGVSWQRPWFEPVPKWKASPTPVEDVLADLGLPTTYTVSSEQAWRRTRRCTNIKRTPCARTRTVMTCL